jgi:hypothetical protein
MIGELAKQALSNEKGLDSKNILEASVVRVELNGYPTGSPLGKKAHELSVSALVSDCEPALRAQVQTSLQKVFPHLTPVYRSAVRALLAVLNARPDTDKDYLIVDMSSEATSLIVVRGGAIAQQHLVPEGVRGILKRIAPTGMPEETLNIIRMLEREQSSSAATETIHDSMGKVEPDLVRVLGEGMSACAAKERLPNKLILIVQPDLAPWLSKFFSRIDFAQFTLTTRPFSVETIATKDLSRWVAAARGVLPDTGIALSVALVNTEQGGR